MNTEHVVLTSVYNRARIRSHQRPEKMTNSALKTLLLTLGLAISAALPALAQSRFPVTTLNIGVHLIKAELAIRDEERAQGLMFREQLGANEGMVFRFPENRPVCMWMKNTFVPLSVAFIDETGKIINIEDMQPQTQDAHCAKRPARYALEMNQGWFRQKSVKPGAKIDGLPK